MISIQSPACFADENFDTSIPCKTDFLAGGSQDGLGGYQLKKLTIMHQLKLQPDHNVVRLTSFESVNLVSNYMRRNNYMRRRNYMRRSNYTPRKRMLGLWQLQKQKERNK